MYRRTPHGITITHILCISLSRTTASTCPMLKASTCPSYAPRDISQGRQLTTFISLSVYLRVLKGSIKSKKIILRGQIPLILLSYLVLCMCGSRGGQGIRTTPPPPLENYNNIGLGFLSNTGPDPLKIIIGPPAKCHLNYGVSLAGR